MLAASGRRVYGVMEGQVDIAVSECPGFREDIDCTYAQVESSDPADHMGTADMTY